MSFVLPLSPWLGSKAKALLINKEHLMNSLFKQTGVGSEPRGLMQTHTDVGQCRMSAEKLGQDLEIVVDPAQ